MEVGRLAYGGVFAQRGHSANYYGDYPGNNPENHPPCGIMHNQFKTQKFKHLMLAMGPRDLNSAPYTAAAIQWRPFNLLNLPNSRWWRTANFSHSARTARAQRTVRPLWLQKHMFRGTWRAVTRACPNTVALCFCPPKQSLTCAAGGPPCTPLGHGGRV